MSAQNSGPWRWSEALLERLLPETTRETIAGDLREEFVEGIEPKRGRLRAQWWYVRQVAGFIPWFAKEGRGMSKVLMTLSTVVLACAPWLAVMETILRHPGYAGRIAEAVGLRRFAQPQFSRKCCMQAWSSSAGCGWALGR